jgi:hypothetical protein
MTAARAAKLIESDATDDVAVIDRLIEATQRTAQIHRDRIEALRGQVRLERLEALDRERAERVAVTERSLATRDAKAAELDTAIADMARLYFELIDCNVEISRQWGMSTNALRTGVLVESLVKREVANALFAHSRPFNGTPRLPGPSNIGLGIAGGSGGTLSERIAGASRVLLEMIGAAPMSIVPPDEEAA